MKNMSNFSEQAIEAYYNGDLKGTALGQKIRNEELTEELQQEYWAGELTE